MISFQNNFSGDAARKIDALSMSLAMIEFDTKGVIRAANANFC